MFVFGEKNPKDWNIFLQKAGIKSTYASHGFCEIFAEYEKGISQLFCNEKKGCKFVLPLILRKVPFENIEIYDAKNPYCYGGIIPGENASIQQSDIKNFKEELIQYLRKTNVISVFCRRNPFSKLNLIEDMLYDKNTTANKNLIVDYKEKYSVRSTTRHCIRKAESNKLELKEAKLCEIGPFVKMYEKSMQQKNQKGFLNFKESFWPLLPKSQSLKLFYVVYQKELIAGCLILECENIADYYLSASLIEYRKIMPNHFMLNSLIERYRDMQYSIFHLGGGSEQLKVFKSGFSNGTVEYKTGTIITDHRKYQDLQKRRKEVKEIPLGDPGFFPEYRSGYE